MRELRDQPVREGDEPGSSAGARWRFRGIPGAAPVSYAGDGRRGAWALRQAHPPRRTSGHARPRRRRGGAAVATFEAESHRRKGRTAPPVAPARREALEGDYGATNREPAPPLVLRSWGKGKRVMNDTKWERWGAASGFGALVVGAAAVVFERGALSASDPITKIAAHYTDNRAALLAQALLFVIGSGFFLWFVASLRSFLMRAEGGSARLSTLAFGTGVGSTMVMLDRACLSDGLGDCGRECRPAGHDQHNERTLYGRQPAPSGDADGGGRTVIPDRGLPDLAGGPFACLCRRTAAASLRSRPHVWPPRRRRLASRFPALSPPCGLARLHDRCDGPASRDLAPCDGQLGCITRRRRLQSS